MTKNLPFRYPLFSRWFFLKNQTLIIIKLLFNGIEFIPSSIATHNNCRIVFRGNCLNDFLYFNKINFLKMKEKLLFKNYLNRCLP